MSLIKKQCVEAAGSQLGEKQAHKLFRRPDGESGGERRRACQVKTGGGGGGNEMKSRSTTNLSLLWDESWHVPAPASTVGRCGAPGRRPGSVGGMLASLQGQSDRFIKCAGDDEDGL